MIKKTGTTKGKPNKLGGGGRFQQVVDKVMASHPKGGMKEAKAIAAMQGIKKYGQKKMTQMAKAGKKKGK